MEANAQMRALAELADLFGERGLDYWLFGGWAVDFHAGRITRPHDDLDIAIWEADRERIGGLLIDRGWRALPDPDADGYAPYERDGVRLELAFLARDERGTVYTPARGGRGEWAEDSFGSERRELEGVRVRLIGLVALKAEKAGLHDDAAVAAKDRADRAILEPLTQRRQA